MQRPPQLPIDTAASGEAGLAEAAPAAGLDDKPDDAADPLPKPHYFGHRDRLRHRLLTAGPDALAEYEMLELVLMQAIPRRDTKPLAKQLIARFGSFAAVVAAEPTALQEVKGVGDGVVAMLKIVQSAAQLMQRQLVLKRPVLGSWQQLIDYCHSIMAHEKIEQFRLLFLDGKNRLIADELQNFGTVNHAPVYIREVVKRALEYHALAVIMCHNHPTGDPSPSRDDITLTREIKKALEVVGIKLHDHLIIGKEGHASLRSLRVIDGWH
jgi:DNA repair protein RadC